MTKELEYLSEEAKEQLSQCGHINTEKYFQNIEKEDFLSIIRHHLFNSTWNGIKIINSPIVDRLWTNCVIDDEKCKVCLHKIYPTNKKPFYHDHPWDMRIYIIDGSYVSNMGGEDGPHESIEFSAGDFYTLLKNEWHSIKPNGIVYTAVVLKNYSESEIKSSLVPLDFNATNNLLYSFKKLLG